MVACFFFFLIPSFPEDARWLSEDERAYVTARLRKDQGRSAVERAISAKDVVNVFKDFKIFLGGFVSVLRKPASGSTYSEVSHSMFPSSHFILRLSLKLSFPILSSSV